MMDKQITLNEYSNKYRVSVSTLRRRIKKQNIEFQFDQGKYFILDKPLHEHRKPPRSGAQKDLAPPHKFNLSEEIQGLSQKKRGEKDSLGSPMVDKASESLVKKTKDLSEVSFAETANELLSELKKAYALILSEKEEQILYLKEEIADLKTLVRVLEGERSSKVSPLEEDSLFDL